MLVFAQVNRPGTSRAQGFGGDMRLTSLVSVVGSAALASQTGLAATNEICKKPVDTAISRIELSQRIKAASLFQLSHQAAQRRAALKLHSDNTLLIRMPAIETTYAGSNAPSFKPIDDMCDTGPNTLRDMLVLGVREVGRAPIASCARVSRAGEMQSPYEAQNVLGAKVQVKRVRFESVSIFMGWLNPDGIFQRSAPQFYGAPSDVGVWQGAREMDDPLRVPMSKAQEVNWRRFGSKYLLVRVRAPYAFSEFGGRAATYSNPTQEEKRSYYLVGDVECIGVENPHDPTIKLEMLLPLTLNDARSMAADMSEDVD